jgi:hypothetical protein
MNHVIILFDDKIYIQTSLCVLHLAFFSEQF